MSDCKTDTVVNQDRSISKRSRKAKTYAADLNQVDNASLHIDMQAIGVVHSTYHERFATPRQATLDHPEPAEIHLNAGLNFEQAVKDLDGFSHVWVIYWMHLNTGWNPTVVPPRGPKVRRGLFATRAPHRPNSIGLSAVRLKKISGRILHIEGHDMLDGTPVLDIKPYIPYADSIADASSGWLAECGLITTSDG
ncbi:tRNA (N6-threonylcarbamoyladenosine(37)-N6)-methyltransferase TrmO [Mariprofundus sp. EBB-1]|uniref:tRNA (N6-threonylcarbamoyladenosine(37)-N6)-methyltransferase TrmO n=1 Tax=Mariprofundus sp. EBB-1 TaxID=2650971 RepID=UPI000EF25C84|nr:tRNA (N6-threonylcarbamoyladenosine(37)-N6)-methyltransferase TrmO [Mariprofundus sp. EBB-1]RLL51075.1 tRNA (N6-threonylcarbamoyladenosine(37)-N6)-methyltransferase TrmO [Mariprofundus sp. EBB-1]